MFFDGLPTQHRFSFVAQQVLERVANQNGNLLQLPATGGQAHLRGTMAWEAVARDVRCFSIPAMPTGPTTHRYADGQQIQVVDVDSAVAGRDL